jgi:hypothetical protein
MPRTQFLSRQESEAFYSRYWFTALARFHKVADPTTWTFDESHVIAFLRSKLALNTPTWKRLKMVDPG